MRILWSINNLVPEVAKKIGLKPGHAISWVDAMSKQLIKQTDIKLAMATVVSTDKLQKYEFDNIVYYLFPVKYRGHDYWADIISDFRPDIIHVYGTEQSHNEQLLDKHTDIPILVSLQGILTEYARHYYGGVEVSSMFKYFQIKDLFLPTGFFSGKKNYLKRSKVEQKILLKAKNVEGRSTWDRVSALKINPNLRYYFLPRMIREPFYDKYKWDIDAIERHSLLVHQGSNPIKCLHFLLESVYMLKEQYPDIKLYIAGKNNLNPKEWRIRLRKHAYINYIKDLISKYNIENNIFFLGFLDADQMAEKLSRVHIAVLPSAIENAPNSIAEAQLVGTPCIASFVGGNMDMLTHNSDGFLYCYNEPNMLAEYIKQIFESDDLAVKFSENGKKVALKRHNQSKLVEDLLKIYTDVIEK